MPDDKPPLVGADGEPLPESPNQGTGGKAPPPAPTVVVQPVVPIEAAPVVVQSPDTWGRRFRDYGAMFLTVIVFTQLSFGMMVAAYNGDTQGLNTLMETVKSLAMIAAGFWIGSSNSSQRKDDTVNSLAARVITERPAGG